MISNFLLDTDIVGLYALVTGMKTVGAKFGEIPVKSRLESHGASKSQLFDFNERAGEGKDQLVIQAPAGAVGHYPVFCQQIR